MQLSHSQSPYKDPYDVVPDTASTTYPTPTHGPVAVAAPLPRHTPGTYAPTILHVGVGNQDQDPVFENPASVANTGLFIFITLECPPTLLSIVLVVKY